MDVGKKLQLSRPLSFYGNEYGAVYILSNGGIGFESSSRTYRSSILPSNLKIIAPFWNRNDLRNGGSVFYREVTSGRVVERGQSEIRYQYDKEVKVQSAIIATWVKMQPLGTAALPEENTNTFQVAIFVTSNGTFANFIYSNIGWTQGAEAGFSSGLWNTGIPGEWMFVLDNDRVLRCKAGIKGDTCDEACGSGEWGPDCAGCCHCAGGAQCNNATGECSACANCWTGNNCQQKSNQCKNDLNKPCAHNAISFTDFDRCGEPTQRCECLTGYEGKGQEECKDVDECAQPGTCHDKAICTNTPGRFFCQCMEGFSGDGVAECIASFLYPHQGEKLPKSRNSKVAWQLKYPLKIFGKERDHIMISTNGLIVVKELSKLNPGDQLDDMEMLGIAPFFAPIDLTSGNGEVVVSETTDSDVLTRATQLINEHMQPGGEPNFRATSVLIISFMNVTTAKSKNANTFQTLLIGGTNMQKEDISFVEFLYKDLVWSDGAEAGIMTFDKTNSIHLPGSGTAGIEQLSQLSNIKLPGIWLYRVDGETVLPCMQMDLQPPYCDAQSPTLIGQRRPSSTLPATTAQTTTQPPSFRHIQPEEPAPSKPSHKKRPTTPSSQSSSDEFTKKPGRRPTHSTTTQNSVPHPHKFTPAFAQVESRTMAPIFMPGSEAPSRIQEGSTQRKPIVALNSKEIEELPPDAFDITFPPTLSMVPKLFSVSQTAEERQPISFIQPELVTPSPNRESWATESFGREELPKEAFPAAPPPTSTKQQELPAKPRLEFDSDASEKVVKVDDSIMHTIVPSIHTTASSRSTEETSAAAVETTVISSTRASSSPSVNQQITTESAESEEEETPPPATTSTPLNNKLFVFTTTKSQKPVPSKPKIVIAPSTHAPKFTKNNGIDDDSAAMPFDPNHVLDAEAPGSKLFVVITVSIVAVWLIILIIVAGFICCQRRRSQLTLRTMYAPACQIRPFPSGKHYAEGHYEDHMDKVNRLKAEQMNAVYNQQAGRMSLYGSYWNISPSSSGQPSTPPLATGLINRSEVASAIAFNSHLLTTNSTNPSQRSPTYLPFATQRYTHAARH
uniref:Uncharacterized protein n=1 Tax=Ditylenchus dipsaci TaxID=166011 RepID=A0A915E034_9BILA